MAANRFRPQLEQAEDRITPAASTDVFGAYARAPFIAQGLQSIISVLEFTPSPAVKTAVGNYLIGVGQQANADAALLQRTAESLVRQAGTNPAGAAAAGAVGIALGQAAVSDQFSGAVATNIANIFGVSPPPPPVVPPPPAPILPTSGSTDNSGLSGLSPGPNDPRFVARADGLKTFDEVIGTGATVPTAASVQVYYTGFLASNGTVFDNNRNNPTPATFTLPSGVITGFAEGLVGIKVGGIRDIFIPARLGYGATGSGTSIPPNSDLIFQAKVVGVTPTTATTGTTTTG